jgi:ABC-type uncharacterized transport system auxiliary subunit
MRTIAALALAVVLAGCSADAHDNGQFPPSSADESVDAMVDERLSALEFESSALRGDLDEFGEKLDVVHMLLTDIRSKILTRYAPVISGR